MDVYCKNHVKHVNNIWLFCSSILRCTCSYYWYL